MYHYDGFRWRFACSNTLVVVPSYIVVYAHAVISECMYIGNTYVQGHRNWASRPGNCWTKDSCTSTHQENPQLIILHISCNQAN